MAMSYTTEFVDGGSGVLHVGTGVVGAEDILAGAIEDHRDAERTRALTHGLVDLTAVTELRIDVDDIRRIVLENRVTARLAGRVRVAVVAPQDVIFGMARMWEAYVEETGWETRVFRSRSEAEAWLYGWVRPNPV